MSNKYFDQLIGTQKDKTTDKDRKLTKNILDAYIKELPKEELAENQIIGVKLKMKSQKKYTMKKVIMSIIIR